MTQPCEPRFDHFQNDIERYLTSIGKREERKDGTIVFRGYDDALEWMFERYLRQEAFDPLVAHFRNWNWDTRTTIICSS